MMKKVFTLAVVCAGALAAAQLNDLSPDFDNTIEGDGFWDTTGHEEVVVSEASSDPLDFCSIETRTSSSLGDALAVLDSRESTHGESTGLARFSSMPAGIIINVR